MSEKIRLTQYSHGAGCGCKIAPDVLETMLKSNLELPDFPNLIVGNDSKDDAAVYDLGDGQSIISTTDFFMPIVDDPFDFGRVAATNAISDIYAMGGRPIMAIAIFGWPIEKLSSEVAALVLEGGRKVCMDAGIPLAGGHSIDAPEPIFGLAVTGIVDTQRVKRNNKALHNAKLYLSKKLGVGILTTAEKKQKLKPEHQRLALDSMCQLNKLGETLGNRTDVVAMTDVTGFGLGGHLIEMAEGSQLSAHIDIAKLPLLDGIGAYIDLDCIPGGTHRNFRAYGNKIASLNEKQKVILCDPQTSGGLLIAVKADCVQSFERDMAELGNPMQSFGFLSEEATNKRINLL
ncbi:MAG: selenide, water dikinase SelD [bacterium]